MMFFKRLLLIVFFAIFQFPALAQLGNEWINFNQFYFKIPVAKDGIYKLSYTDLRDSGFPIDFVDPRRIQIFHRGTEQSIFVQGESDAHFDAGDFVEFYGKRNDGTLDAELYVPATSQPHPYYNLYNDTTSYFLTFNPAAVAGKRMDSFFEVNVTSIPKDTYHTDEKLLVLTDTYSTGVTYADYLQSTLFDQAEGWSGAEIRQTQFLDYTLTNVLQGVTSQSKPILEMGLMGHGEMIHEAVVSVGPNSGSVHVVTTKDFYGYTSLTFSQIIDWTDIGADGKVAVRVMANGVGGQPDRFAVSYIKLRYAQKTDAAGATEKIFNLVENPSGKSYVEIQNPSAGTRLFDVTDPDNPVIIGTTLTTTLNAVVPYTSTSRKIYATSADLTPVIIRPVSFRQITPGTVDYVIISNKSLMKPALGYSNVVKAFGSYRASAEGGGYDTLIVDVNQLYDQFNYGETSPLAIFHFMKFLCSATPPKYLFIIGKALTVNYGYYRNPTAYPVYKDFVPTAGLPGSDSYYTVGLAGAGHEPAVPTGRITATQPSQVAAYLNKVKEMEALPYNDLWRKNLLHLSGGIHTGEPEEFRAIMQDFQSTAQGYHLGGNVKAIPKQTTDIQLVNISAEVNKGLNLVTFFGHSSPATIDFDIGFVTDPVLGYNNPGKYPTLLMNGCNAGSFFLNSVLFGEDWINAANKGAIGFIAHSSYGFVNYLKMYTDLFYNVGYGDSTFIYKGLGDIQKEVGKRYAAETAATVVDDTQIQQMVLLGDPAARLFGARKADYEINEDNVFIESFDGAPVTALTDSFALKFVVRNFGQAKEANMVVELTRTFADNSSVVDHKVFPPVLYSDTLIFVVRRNSAGGGSNSFQLRIDSDDLVPELNENNNTVKKGIIIPLNGTKNLFPSNFAIVSHPDVTLTLQTTDLQSAARDVLIEIDTVNTFASPYKKQFTAKGSVLIKQAVTTLTQDTLAYYWRTKLAQPNPGESTDWTLSSFTYIDHGADGWAQVHFPQFLTNNAVGFEEDAALRKFKFLETDTDISVKTFGSANAATNKDVSFKINGAEYNIVIQQDGAPGCRTNTINLVAFDKTSTVPYTAIPFKLVDPRNCGRVPQVINSFQLSETDTGNGDDIAQYVDNVLVGDSVVLFSIGDAGIPSWSSTVKTKLGELGISTAQINALQAGEPVVIFAKKGAPAGTAKVYKTSSSPANQQTLFVDETITGRYTSGKMNSVLIGPAQRWDKFLKQVSNDDATDQVSFDITGVTFKNSEQVLFADVTADTDLSTINASDFPYLRVTIKAEDNVNLTPAQLRKWIVLFEPVAEGLLVYHGSPAQQVVQEGAPWSGHYSFVNIGDKVFLDSLTVQYEAVNTTTRTSVKKSMKIAPPAIQDSTHFTVTFNTRGNSGVNDVDVFVNPHIIAEQYYDNNEIYLNKYLNIQSDVFNPVLDVTIDGRYVTNGDFVSPSPFIRVHVWDENHIVLKKDTVGMNMFLQYPCADQNGGCDFERINFSRADITWVAATDTSDFMITFNPQQLPEGEYTLQVQGSDANGNASGSDPYTVTFQVKYETSFTLLSPHPNPSTGTFYFPFAVSGAVVPDYFDLQIMSVEGKLLQDIKLDGASFHIGINDVQWSGKDAAGYDQPAGVYVYKLVVRTDNRETHRNGKLVLLK